MNLLTIIAIALGLAMDAFAIGAAYEKPAINHAFRASLVFGIF